MYPVRYQFSYFGRRYKLNVFLDVGKATICVMTIICVRESQKVEKIVRMKKSKNLSLLSITHRLRTVEGQTADSLEKIK